MQIEHGTFSPLVFSATGGLGRECEKVYNRIASVMAEKRQCPYSALVTWIRRKISFAFAENDAVVYHSRQRIIGDSK